MNDEIIPDNERDNRIIAMMNDASLCPVLEESKVGVSDYTKLPVSRLAALSGLLLNHWLLLYRPL